LAWRYILGPVVAFRHLAGCGSHAGLREASAQGSHCKGTEVARHLRSAGTPASSSPPAYSTPLNTGCPPRRSVGSSQAPTDRRRGQPCAVPVRRASTAGRLP